MRVGWVSVFDPAQRRGGWQGMSHGLLAALRRRPGFATEPFAPVAAARDPAAMWRSRLLTAVSGRRLVWSHSDRALAGAAAAFAARAAGSGVDAYLFFGSGDYLAVRPPRPYACYVDSAFVPFLRLYAADRRYLERDLRRLADLERRWLGGAAAVLTTSEFARRAILDAYGLPAERVVAVGAGPNLDAVAAPSPVAARGRSVLFVGADFLRKGGDIAVSAVEQARRAVPDLTLDVVGEAPPPEWRRGFVRVHGWIDRGNPAGAAQFDRLLRGSALFLTLSRADLTPAAIAEASAHGLPTLAAAVGGIPEMVIDGETGWLAPPGDVAAVAERLCAALSDPARAMRAGAAARRLYETWWNWDAVAARVGAAMEGAARAAGGAV